MDASPTTATFPDPIAEELDYSGTEADDILAGGGDGGGEEETSGTRLDSTGGASPMTDAPPIPAVYAAAITPAQWADMPSTLRDDMVRKAPLTVQKVHALDAEALTLQRRLEDEAAREAIQVATALQTSARNRLQALLAKKERLRQQLASADRELSAAASDTDTQNQAVASAEQSARTLDASRRRPQAAGTLSPPGRTPRLRGGVTTAIHPAVAAETVANTVAQ
ncbi:unnamed protein product, partial [Laminaria digitata]